MLVAVAGIFFHVSTHQPTRSCQRKHPAPFIHTLYHFWNVNWTWAKFYNFQLSTHWWLLIYFSILSAVWNLHSRNHCSVFLSIDIPRGIRSYTHLMAFMMSYHLLLIDQASFSIKLRWVSRCGAKKAMQAAPRMLLACFQSLHVRRATICPFLQRLKECERCPGTLPPSRLTDKIGGTRRELLSPHDRK